MKQINTNDIVGNMIGKLIVKEFLYVRLDVADKVRRRYYYRCQCICEKANEIVVERSEIERRWSCGCDKIYIANPIENLTDIVNKKFGELTVLRYDKKENGRHKYICICSCNPANEISVCREKLMSGNTQSCGCLKHMRGNKSKMWKGVGEIDSRTWRSINKWAVIRNIDVKVTRENCWNKFIEQHRICALGGEYLTFDSRCRTASLDRIDSEKDYTLDNIQWVHKDINRMKWDLNIDSFIKYCYLVSHPEKTNLEYQITNQVDCNLGYKVTGNLHPNWKGHKGLSYQLWHRILRNAESRKIKVNLTIEEAWDLFVLQNYQCIYTRILLSMNTIAVNRIVTKPTASLDRIDSSKGYEIGNVQWVHKDINCMKRNFSDTRFRELCKAVADNCIKRNTINLL